MDLSNPTTNELLPLLFGPTYGEGKTSRMRASFVEHDVQSTLVIPGDWPVSQSRWYERGMFAAKPDNNVKYLIDAVETYKLMERAIATAKSDSHFVVICGWSLDMNFSLDGGSGRTLRNVLKDAYDRDVWIRILLWKPAIILQPYWAKMRESVKTADATFRGKAPDKAMLYLDSDTNGMGSHHQKLLLVSGEEGLYAFFGGIDFFRDRVSPGAGPGDPQHDVHSVTTGAAATDLYEIVKQRWTNCSTRYQTFGLAASNPELQLLMVVDPLSLSKLDGPPWQTADPAVNGLSASDSFARLPAPIPGKPHGPRTTLRFMQTIGNPKIAGTSDIWPQLRHGIRMARRFIYCEDQYFWSLDAANEINAALKATPDLSFTLILPVGSASSGLRRAALNALIKNLSLPALNNINVCRRKIAGAAYGAPATPHTYIHAKMWIFDDELAVVGSANCNNRGYQHDSELDGAYTDPDWAIARTWYDLEMNLAHKLRVELWREHLRLPAEALHDPLAALLYWRHPSSKGAIEQFSENGVWWFTEAHPFHVPPLPAERWLMDPETDAKRYYYDTPAPALPWNPVDPRRPPTMPPPKSTLGEPSDPGYVEV